MLCSADSLLSQWQDVQCLFLEAPGTMRAGALLSWGLQAPLSLQKVSPFGRSVGPGWGRVVTALPGDRPRLHSLTGSVPLRRSWTHKAAPGNREAVGAVVRLGLSVMDEAYLRGVWPWECCTFVEIQVCQTLLLQKNLTASFGSQWHLFIF